MRSVRLLSIFLLAASIQIAAAEGEKDADISSSMALSVPQGYNDKAVASPADLYLTVTDEWDAVVGNNDNGLVPPKQQNQPQPDLGEEEAWYQYERTQSGNVDSARFLLVFGMVPSIKSGGSKIHTAAASGDLEGLKKQLETSTALIAVNEEKKDGMTPLITASMMGHEKVVAYLIDEGADVEAVGTNGATALMIAASMGHLPIMKQLIDAGTNVDAEHKFAKNTALHFAAEMGRHKAVALLCEAGADVEREKTNSGRPIHTASDTNNTAVVAVLANATGPCKADTNSLLLGDSTPLYLAAQRGFVEVGRTLLANGADVDFEMPVGGLEKHVALPEHFGPDAKGANKWKNQPGSDPFAEGWETGNGATALHAAVENGHLEMARMLLDHGAKQRGSMEGCTPLCSASQYNHPEIAALLLDEKYEALTGGAKAGARLPRGGDTPMIDAIKRRHYKVVEAMAKAGQRGGNAGGDSDGSDGKVSKTGQQQGTNAVTEFTDSRGLPPLFWAMRSMGTEVAESLLKHGADPNAAVATTAWHRRQQQQQQDGGGRGYDRSEHEPGTRALHAAIADRRNDIVGLLLQHGADVSLTGPSRALVGASAPTTAAVAADADSTAASTAAATAAGVLPLHVAAAAGNEQAAQALLSKGPLWAGAVHAKGGRYRSTPAHEAARHARPGMLRMLVEYAKLVGSSGIPGAGAADGGGARLSAGAAAEAMLWAKQTNGHTPLHTAAAGAAGAGAGTGSAEELAQVVRLLLSVAGATARTARPPAKSPGTDADGSAAAAAAATAAAAAAAVGAHTVDTPANSGQTALALAAEAGNKDGVQVLLEAGADWSLADKKGRTALSACNEGEGGGRGTGDGPLGVLCALPVEWRVEPMEALLRRHQQQVKEAGGKETPISEAILTEAKEAADAIALAAAGTEQGQTCAEGDEKCKAGAEGDEQKRASYYVKLLQKARKNADKPAQQAEYLHKERKRLLGLIRSGKIQPGQKAQLFVRRQVAAAIARAVSAWKPRYVEL